MKYQKIVEGIFKERPNRFIAKVEIEGNLETVHVKNTGRCRELLVPGVKVFLEDFDGRMGSRKLRYSLVAVEKKCESSEKTAGCKVRTLLVNMDSQAPNALIKEEFQKWAETSGGKFKPETTYKNSRFDFSFELPGSGEIPGQQGFLEVKGVTLEENGFCRFPDAPTERGTKHLQELIDAKKNGFWAGVLFLVQIDGMKSFSPNDETDPEFGKSLRMAAASGVEILCYGCKVKSDSLVLGEPIGITL